MAISGADSAKVNRVLTTTLDRYSEKISNEIARNEGVIAAYGLEGAIKVVSGGERAIETVDYAENPNVDFRSKYTNIPTTRADTRLQAKYAWATLSGAIAINDIEQAMNQGSARIYELVEAELTNIKNTFIRKIADGLRAATPAATDPESVYSMCQDTTEAGQTGSFGELSRVTYNSWWRNAYTDTAMDLSATAGLEALTAFYLNECSKGTSKIDQPNIGLMNGTLFAALSAGHGDANRRFTPNDKMAKLGFTNIQVMNATIICDPSITAGDTYLLNTNYSKIQVLRTPGMRDIGNVHRRCRYRLNRSKMRMILCIKSV